MKIIQLEYNLTINHINKLIINHISKLIINQIHKNKSIFIPNYKNILFIKVVIVKIKHKQ